MNTVHHLLLFLIVISHHWVRAHARSTGAGGCESASSYTHGKDAAEGDGGYFIQVDKTGSYADSPYKVLVSGGEAFKGLLLYISHGSFDALPSTMHFKTSCDDSRGSQRTITHTSPAPKTSVSVDLWLQPEDVLRNVQINAVVLRGVREWFWLQDIPFSSLVSEGPASPPSASSHHPYL